MALRFERSCGAVIFTRVGTEIRYVIIQSLAGTYGFPKGHMEPGETERETALREIREETGLRVRLVPGFRMEDEYALPGRMPGRKRVIYFLAEYQDQPLTPQASEILSIQLLPYEMALSVIPFENARRILSEAENCRALWEKRRPAEAI